MDAFRIMEGVYSETKVQEIGTMGTARRQTVVDYYKCVQIDDDKISIQVLDMDGNPLPLKETVQVEDFLKRFTYVPEKVKAIKTPAQVTAERYVAMAEKHFERNEMGSAEYEYQRAIKVDQENVRANFGLGKLYLATGKPDQAAGIFSGLARQDNMMEPENKHFFNDLGRELRALKLYDQAIEFYEKARTMPGLEDEHLLFNLARAAYEGGDLNKAKEYLGTSLSLNPGFELALTFKMVLDNG
ncbi:MAG: tetratricopeptide repeat protein [Candidatus Adiutrix sp.]|nr:tetratricopeptide repeat protein [Candidatus Adiutrix sp.]